MYALTWFLGPAMVIFVAVCAWRLASKTGHPGWVGLLCCIPLLNILMIAYFAFSEWPIEFELKHCKEHQQGQARQEEC